MGLAYNVYLSSNKIYGCKNCKTHLSNHEDIISRVGAHRSLAWPRILMLTARTHAELPRPAWESISLQLCRELYRWRAERTQHDHRKAHCSRHLMPAVQGDRRLEIRQGI